MGRYFKKLNPRVIIIGLILFSSILFISMWFLGFRFGFGIPPGCFSGRNNILPTGCFSKNMAFYFSYSSAKCLSVRINNCSEVRVELENLCGLPLEAEGKLYSASEKYVYLDGERKFFIGSGKVGSNDYWWIKVLRIKICK